LLCRASEEEEEEEEEEELCKTLSSVQLARFITDPNIYKVNK
jgi:hypothetical protein